jgi:hypothetical protein
MKVLNDLVFPALWILIKCYNATYLSDGKKYNMNTHGLICPLINGATLLRQKELVTSWLTEFWRTVTALHDSRN